MKKFYVPINGNVVVDADTEDQAYEKARAIVSGLDQYDCGDASVLEEDDESEVSE